jgi:hypothetical protein
MRASEIRADIMALQKHALDVKTGRLINVGSFSKGRHQFLDLTATPFCCELRGEFPIALLESPRE